MSVALASFSSLLFLSPVFLGALTTFDDGVHLTDDILFVRQEISVFVDRRVPRTYLRPVDVGDIRERDESFTVRPINLFYWPVPLKPCFASFCALDDLRRLTGIRVHVRPGITHERLRSRFISVSKSGRFGVAPREVCGQRDKGR